MSSKVTFLIDEAASLGHLECIDDAIDKYRGYGVQLILIYQSLAQLKHCFPNGQDVTVLSNTTQIYFSVAENQTATYISDRLGEETIVVESGGTSCSYSSQSSNGAQDSTSYSSNSSYNWQQNARRLLKPDEVMMLPPRTAITFAQGLPPIWTTLVRAYEEPSLGKRDGHLRSFLLCSWNLGCAGAACCIALLIATVLTIAVYSSRENGFSSQLNHARPGVPVGR